MNWTKIKCALFGHSWVQHFGSITTGVHSHLRCKRCGMRDPALRLDEPTRPAPPMPTCKPVRTDEPTAIHLTPGDTIILRVDRSLSDQQRAHVEAHAQRRLPEGASILVLDKSIAFEVVRARPAPPVIPQPIPESRGNPPPPPAPPPARLIRDGVYEHCPRCGSSAVRRWWLFGPLQCIRSGCNMQPRGAGDSFLD